MSSQIKNLYEKQLSNVFIPIRFNHLFQTEGSFLHNALGEAEKVRKSIVDEHVVIKHVADGGSTTRGLKAETTDDCLECRRRAEYGRVHRDRGLLCKKEGIQRERVERGRILVGRGHWVR